LDSSDMAENSGVLCGVPVVLEEHAGAVVLLVCEVFGGRVPPDIVAPGAMEVRMNLGKAHASATCIEASKPDPGALGEKTQRSIERLAGMNLKAEAIAEALGEDLGDVERIMRRHGWNLECPQKLSALVHPEDLTSASNVHITALTKGRKLAHGGVRLETILHHANARHSSVVSLCDQGSPIMELDVEIRLFALAKQEPGRI